MEWVREVEDEDVDEVVVDPVVLVDEEVAEVVGVEDIRKPFFFYLKIKHFRRSIDEIRENSFVRNVT